MQIYIHTYIYICIYTHTSRVYAYLCRVYAYLCIYIHTYIYICIYTHHFCGKVRVPRPRQVELPTPPPPKLITRQTHGQIVMPFARGHSHEDAISVHDG